MFLRNATALFLACLLMGSACLARAGQDPATAPGLKLTPPPVALQFGRNDPPGTWYGDTSGLPVEPDRPQGDGAYPQRCPPGPDGLPKAVSGSISAGMGHASGLGSSRWTAGQVDYCKDYVTRAGKRGAVNLQLELGRHQGPGPAPFHGPFDAAPRPGRGLWGNPWTGPDAVDAFGLPAGPMDRTRRERRR
jgi:hypothetical protein